MSPRSDRILISETSIYASPSLLPSTLPTSHSFPGLQKQGGSLDRHNHQYLALSSPSIPRVARSSSSSSTTGARPKLGSKKDVWIIEFSDVILECQRVGTTNLPTSIIDQSNVFSSSPSKRKKKSKGISLGSERNLYKFNRVVRWIEIEGNGSQSQSTRRSSSLSAFEGIEPMSGEEEAEGLDEDDEGAREGAASRMRYVSKQSVLNFLRNTDSDILRGQFYV
jgi:hypothetical protein